MGKNESEGSIRHLTTFGDGKIAVAPDADNPRYAAGAANYVLATWRFCRPLVTRCYFVIDRLIDWLVTVPSRSDFK